MIEALRAPGYEIVGIAGSSMGAMVGGLQAAGRLDEFDLLIEVPRSTCRGLEFHRAVEVIAAGRALAFDALEAGPDRTASPAIDG